MLNVCKRSMDAVGPYFLRLKTNATMRSVMSVISGDLTRTLISFVTSILIARWTLPYDMGVWNGALLVTVYAPVLQCGVLNGLNRQLPYLIGTGDKAKALKVASAAYAWMLILTVASTLVTIGVAGFLWLSGHGPRVYTAIAIGINVICYWTTMYFTVTYRTSGQFGRLARNMILTAVAGLLLTGLVWYLHYNGILLRASLLSLFGVAILYWHRPIAVRPLWSASILMELGKIGIPIWVVGQLGSFFTSFDRVVLVRSPQMLGYFTIAIQVAAFARTIPYAFSVVLYPKIAHRYGESHHAMAIWQVARKGAMAACAFGVACSVCGWFLLPHVVKHVLPRYVPGVASAQWASLMALAASASVFDIIYNVIRRQDLYVMNWLIGTAVFFGSWFAMTHWAGEVRIVAAAQSMLIATAAMSVLSFFISRHACVLHDRRTGAAQ